MVYVTPLGGFVGSCYMNEKKKAKRERVKWDKA